MKVVAWSLAVVIGIAVITLIVWSVVIGPQTVWRVVTHGTTTIWDHLEYPGRHLTPSPAPDPWPVGSQPLPPPDIEVDGASVPLETVLSERDALAFLVIGSGEILYEWYAIDHGPETPSMVFSVTKSLFSLLFGAAIDDGIIGSVSDPVTAYLPELVDRRFDAVTLEDLLRMDSSVDYVENDNPFGLHIEFNYTPELAEAITALRVRDEPDPEFRYKSGDNAVLGLILDRALGDRSITDYMEERLFQPLGAGTGGVWSTDHEGGLERTWCCLAMTARDLARFGQLVLGSGEWHGERLISASWLEASFQPGFGSDRWPADYDGSPIANYGYGWWLTDEAIVALGKGGQYLYIDPGRRVVIVRLGKTQGGVGWVDILSQVAESLG